jgi:hypothetical protein
MSLSCGKLIPPEKNDEDKSGQEANMLRRHPVCGFLAVAIWLLAGCATTLEENWGTSYQQAKQNQLLDPAAGKNLEPVEGLDGHASSVVMKRYYEALEKGGLYVDEEGKNPFSITVAQ